MATEKIIINFKTAYQLMQDLDLAKKRQKNEITDYDIIVEILHHERVELIDLSDENLDPDKLVSFFFKYSEFHGLEADEV